MGWFGVVVIDGRVVELDLYENGLSGELPAEIGDLTALEYLDIEDNGMTGSLPSSLTNLTELSEFYFNQTYPETEPQLCAPLDATFQTWLGSIDYTGPNCPLKVTGLTITPTSSTLSVSWTAPAITGDYTITGYNVRYRKADTDLNQPGNQPGDWQDFSHTGVGTSATISNLTAETRYDVQVLVIQDPTRWEDWVMETATTSSGGGLAAPGMVTGLSVSATSWSQLSVMWSPPTETGGSAVNGYSVQYREADTDPDEQGDQPGDWQDFSHTGVGTSATISNLTAATRYDVQVAAKNSVDTGAYAQRSATTTAATVPGTPGSVTVNGTSSTALAVSWVAPTDNGGSAVSGYSVQYRETDTDPDEQGDQPGQWQNVTRTGTGTSVTILDLTAETRYDVQVAAKNSVDTGAYAEGSGATLAVTALETDWRTLIAVYNATGGAQWTDDTNWSTSTAQRPTEQELKFWRGVTVNNGRVTGLDLRNNNLTGSLPAKMGDLTALTFLYISGNGDGLDGPLPAALTSLSDLTDISIGGNDRTLCFPLDESFQTWLAGVTTKDGPYCVEETDWRALIAVYNATDGAQWTNNTNWSTSTTEKPRDTELGGWHGVTMTNGRVTSLDLRSNNLAGSVPTEVGNLTALESLFLGGNSLAGSLPGSFTDLTSLTSLLFSDNGGTATSVCAPLDATFQTWLAGVKASSEAADASGVTGPDCPMRVSGLTIAPTSSTLSVSWTAPTITGRSTIAGYRVEYREADTDLNQSGNQPGQWQSVTRTGTGTSTAITGLVAATRYDVQVAVSPNPPGLEAYEQGTATTGAATVPGEVTDLAVSVTSQTELSMTWSSPTETGGRAVEGYSVQYREADTNFELQGNQPGEWQTVPHTGVGTSATVSDLTVATRYDVQVAAENDVGTGAYVQESATTGAATVPGAVTSLSVSATSGSQLSVTWSSPTEIGGSAVEGYSVQYREADTNFELQGNQPGTWQTVTHTSTGTSTMITDLTAATQYDVQVAASNDSGQGAYAQASATTLSATVPGMVADLSVIAASGSQLSVTWSSPTETGGRAVEGYSVQYRLTDNNSDPNEIEPGDWQPVSHTGVGTSATVPMLTAATQYDVQVAAKNSKGTGEYVQESATTGVAMVPETPGSVTVVGSSSTSLAVSWVAPTDNGGSAVSGYSVQYREADTDPDEQGDQPGNWQDFRHTGTGTSVTIPDLTAETRYDVQVAAINSVDTGAYAEESGVTLALTALETDWRALIAVYSATGGAQWTDKTNWSTSTAQRPTETELNGWHGVTVNNGRVSELDLSYNNLTGSLPAEVGDLTALTFLYISGNGDGLDGPLPAELTSLSDLTDFRIGGNDRTLCFPLDDSFQTWLAEVTIKTGPYCVEETDWRALIAVYNATGGAQWTDKTNWSTSTTEKPGDTELGAWHGVAVTNGRVTSLDLRSNNLAGSVPTEVGDLTAVQYLDFSDNSLTGSLPGSFTDLTSLTTLSFFNTERTATSVCAPLDVTFQTWLAGVKDSQEAADASGVSGPDCPMRVTGLTIAPTSTTLSVSWTAPTITGRSTIAGYRVQVREADTDPDQTGNQPGNWQDVVHTGVGTSATIPELTAETRYDVQVAVRPNPSGLEAFVQEGGTTAAVTVPGIPGSVTVVGSSSTSLAVSWVAPTDNGGSAVSGYSVQYREADTDPNEQGDQPGQWQNVTRTGTGTNAAITGLTAETRYDVQVAAINSVDTGAYAEESGVTLALTALETDWRALIAVYNETDGAQWTDNTKWSTSTAQRPTEPELNLWHGVTVNNGRVTGLDLRNNNLTGSLPAEMGDLTALTFLYISGNGDGLDGPLPAELTSLSDLTGIAIGGNDRTLCFPLDDSFQTWLAGVTTKIGPYCVEEADWRALIAVYNATGGAQWTNMTNWSTSTTEKPGDTELNGWHGVTVTNGRVTRLDLRSNNLAGSVPTQVGNLTALETLILDGNSLTGGLPGSFTGLTSLTTLSFLNNGRTATSVCAPLDATFQTWLAGVKASPEAADASGVSGRDCPMRVTGLTITSTSTTLSVSWTAPTNTGRSTIAGYRVQYREADMDLNQSGNQ